VSSLLAEGNEKHNVKVASNGIMLLAYFIKIGHLVQELK
jgi:hypothetical protein